MEIIQKFVVSMICAEGSAHQMSILYSNVLNGSTGSDKLGVHHAPMPALARLL